MILKTAEELVITWGNFSVNIVGGASFPIKNPSKCHYRCRWAALTLWKKKLALKIKMVIFPIV